MSENTMKKRRLGALEWCLIIASVVIILGVAVRMNVLSLFTPKAEPELTEYLVSFRVENVRSTSGDLFGNGTTFYLDGTGDVFGTVSGNVATTPAEIYLENENGEYVLVYYSDDGDDSRVDISGTFLVKASVSEDKGLFMLNGEHYIAPNLTFKLYSGELTVSILITDITET